ncbi:MAG: TetR/AcrR family transcriptional regulator [Clostridiales bacterium]|nr:TetR/AcrR family transcriptional regulator [Clostridiales bacterium]MCF8023763.1 TetR/AcrR family transcriptional regulator [Clostridiales bacterium]
MTNLRERKKQKTREKIINTAREIFLSRGYQKTTITQIARKTNTGIGTFYNYFSSKSELFLNIFYTHPQELETRGNKILYNPGENVIESITDLCLIYINGMSNVNKELWKEIIEVFFSNIDSHQQTMSEFTELDFQLIKQVQYLLGHYQEKKLLVDNFNPRDGAECIYSIFAAQLILYLYEKENSLELVKDKVERQVRLFFADKFL